MHHIQPRDRPAKDRMLPVQPRRLLRRDEELAPVRVGTRVRHAQRVRLVMFEGGELVFEFAAPDGFPARAVAVRVAALDHEFADHAVEDGVVVVAVAGVGDEVFDGFGGRGGEESEVDVAHGGVEDGRGAGFRGALGGGRVSRVSLSGFLVLDVSRGLGDLGLVGEHVEADLGKSCRDEHRVALFGFLE